MTVLQFLCLWEILWFDNILQFWCLWEILWFDNISNLSCNLIPLKQSCVLLFSSRKLLVQSGEPGGGGGGFVVRWEEKWDFSYLKIEEWALDFKIIKTILGIILPLEFLEKPILSLGLLGCTTIFLGMLNIDNGSNNKIKL